MIFNWKTIGTTAALLLLVISCFCSRRAKPTAVPPSLEAPAEIEAQALSATAIQIQWNSVAGVSLYKVYRDTCFQNEFPFLAELSDTVWIDTGLTPGTNYHYQVRAWNEDGYSPASMEDSAATLCAAPAEITATPLSNRKISLSWGHVSGASEYILWRTHFGSDSFDSLASSAETSFVDTSVSGGFRYCYRLAALNSSGRSELSTSDSALTNPDAPDSLSLITLSARQYRLSWKSARGSRSYTVYRGTNTWYMDSVVSIEATSWVDSSFTSSTKYFYAIRAWNATGYSPLSKIDSIIALPRWNSVGLPGFSPHEANCLSLAFAGDVPYVAFGDGDLLGGATVMRCSANVWVYTGAPRFSTGSVENVSMAINGNDPFIAFKDLSFGGRATVMKFNGTTWEYVGPVGFTDSTADHLRLAFDNGTPYVAFRDGRDSTFRATVMKFSGSNWEVVGTESFSDSAITHMSLVIDNGIPYVAFSDESRESKATVMKYDGTAWTVVGTPGFTDGPILYPALVVRNGLPVLAFRDFARSGKTSVMEFTGSEWAFLGGSGISEGHADFIDLKSFEDILFIGYYDWTLGMVVKKFNGSLWQSVGEAMAYQQDAAYLSLAIHEGIPYVAFRDGQAGYRASVMRFH